MFSSEGLLLVDMEKIAIVPLSEPLPTTAELDLFRSTSLLSTTVAEMTQRKLAQSRMAIGDRVKVVSGAYLGLIGEVKGVTENEVAVYLPSQGIAENMIKDALRTEFDVADLVRILDGRHQGLVGCVTRVSSDTLHVSNAEAKTEVDRRYYTVAKSN